jgi:hypothetical protein
MRKKRTILWGGIVLLILIGAGWGWYLYDKPHRSAAGITPDLIITADSLYSQYQNDERTADRKFMGKILAVSEIWILSADPKAAGGINCQFFAGTKIDQEPKPGDAVTIKGRCTGFLMDVNLTDCVPDK